MKAKLSNAVKACYVEEQIEMLASGIHSLEKAGYPAEADSNAITLLREINYHQALYSQTLKCDYPSFYSSRLHCLPLPPRESKGQTTIVRSDGNISVICTSLSQNHSVHNNAPAWIKPGLPSGAMARAVLCDLTRYVRYNKTRTLRLGYKASCFIRDFSSIDATSGSTRNQYLLQLYRLANMAIAIRQRDRGHEQAVNLVVAKESEWWWDANSEGRIELSEEFAEGFIKDIFPVSPDYLRFCVNRRSTAAFDIMCHVQRKVFSLSHCQSSGSVVFPLSELIDIVRCSDSEQYKSVRRRVIHGIELVNEYLSGNAITVSNNNVVCSAHIPLLVSTKK